MGSGITSGECQAQDAINISEEAVSQWLYTSVDTVFVTIITPIMFCFGVTTNFTFLFAVFRVPKVRTETYIYLMHLALADLLFLSSDTALSLWRYMASPVEFHDPFVNSAGCVSFFLVASTGYFASIALITMVSFERFFAICHPLKHLKIRGKRRTFRLVVICWLAGMMVSGPMMPRYAFLNVICPQWPDDSVKYQGFPSMAAYYGPIQPWMRYYTRPVLNLIWVIAMVANIYMYVCILHTLNKRRGANSLSKKDKKTQETRNQVAKMLIVNGAVFFLCQTPYRFCTIIGWIYLLAEIPNPVSAALGDAGYWACIILVYINSIVNPLIYGAVNSQYRAAFIRAFHCKALPRKNGPV